MTDNSIRYMFSVTTGDVYTIEEDELKNMDSFQIPLKRKPPSSCKKCYGRMHIGFARKDNTYVLCPTCTRRYVDVELMSKLRNHVKTA